ncbi:hypothetical protein HK405_009284, partial [Cladochytrium tenue]
MPIVSSCSDTPDAEVAPSPTSVATPAGSYDANDGVAAAPSPQVPPHVGNDIPQDFAKDIASQPTNGDQSPPSSPSHITISTERAERDPTLTLRRTGYPMSPPSTPPRRVSGRPDVPAPSSRSTQQQGVNQHIRTPSRQEIPSSDLSALIAGLGQMNISRSTFIKDKDGSPLVVGPGFKK